MFADVRVKTTVVLMVNGNALTHPLYQLLKLSYACVCCLLSKDVVYMCITFEGCFKKGNFSIFSVYLCESNNRYHNSRVITIIKLI